MKENLEKLARDCMNTAILCKIEEEIESEILHAIRIIEASSTEDTAEWAKDRFGDLLKEVTELICDAKVAVCYGEIDEVVSKSMKDFTRELRESKLTD